MNKSTVIKHFGGVTATAKALKITPQAVSKWPAEVPEQRAWQIQIVTRGKLKAR